MDHLAGQYRADAAIVGASLTGLLIASALKHEGMQVAVIDAADRQYVAPALPASPLYCSALTQVDKSFGASIAEQYAAALMTQFNLLTGQPRPYVHPRPAYIFARRPEDLPALDELHQCLTELHVPSSTAPDAGGCPFPVTLSLTGPGALVDTSRWLSALEACICRNGGWIFRRSPVTAITDTGVHTARGSVEAAHILLTAGTPPGLRNPQLLALLENRRVLLYPLKSDMPLHSLQQDVSGGMILLPAKTGSTALWDAGRLGTDVRRRTAEFDWLLRHRLPDWEAGEMQHMQATHSLDGLPVIGPLPGSRLLCASGMQSIPAAMHAADLLTRRILGRPQPEDAVYAADRPLHRSLTLRNAMRHAGHSLRRGAPACAHCGCRMRYCPPAQQWECPFCGTAYTMLGQVITGPGLQSARVSVRQRPDI